MSPMPTPMSSIEEIKDLFAAGADVVQLDEPWMVSFSDKARNYGIKALNRRLKASRARSPFISASATLMW